MFSYHDQTQKLNFDLLCKALDINIDEGNKMVTPYVGN